MLGAYPHQVSVLSSSLRQDWRSLGWRKVDYSYLVHVLRVALVPSYSKLLAYLPQAYLMLWLIQSLISIEKRALAKFQMNPFLKQNLKNSEKETVLFELIYSESSKKVLLSAVSFMAKISRGA